MIFVDLDRTLAYYESGNYTTHGPLHIGDPIPAMVEKVKGFIKEGKEVKIFTARAPETHEAVADWTEKHLGTRLEVTNVKDWRMEILYDDRAVQVIPNMGVTVIDYLTKSDADISVLAMILERGTK